MKTWLDEWREFFSRSINIYKLIFTIIILAAELSFFAKFLLYVESRTGTVLDDPILRVFSATDFNYPIFILIYGSILLGLVTLVPNPKQLVTALQSYILMVAIRTIAMYVTPLDVPNGIINLRDPLVFIVGTGSPVTKDLFFSGHTATMTILFLTAKNKVLKYIFLMILFIVVSMILLQKAHYTIDIIAGFLFSYLCFIVAKRFNSDETKTNQA